MRKLRRLAAAAAITTMVAVVGIATVPAANAGTEAPPAAYTIVNASLLLSCRLATVDLATGETVPLGSGTADACVRDLAVGTDGSVWGVRQLQEPPALVHFDPATGALLSSEEITGNFQEASLVEGGLAFDAAGTLYVQLVTDEPVCDALDAVCLYTIDPATAIATFVGGPGSANEETAFSFLGADCVGNMVTTESSRAATGGAETPWDDVDAQDFFRQLDFVDPVTGIVTDGPDFPDGFNLAGLDYDRVSGVLYALGSFEGVPPTETSATTTEGADAPAQPDVQPTIFEASLFTVNTSTGEVTEVAPLSDLEINVTTLGIGGTCPVPEPVPAPLVLTPTFTG